MELLHIAKILRINKKIMIVSIFIGMVLVASFSLFFGNVNILDAISSNKLLVANRDKFQATTTIRTEIKKSTDNLGYYGIYMDNEYFNDFYFWCQSGYVNDEAIKRLGTSISFKELNNRYTIQKIDDSRLIKIIGYGNTVGDAIEVTEAVTSVIIAYAKEYISQVDKVYIVDPPINIYSPKESQEIKNNILAKADKKNNKYGFFLIVFFGGITLGFLIGITVVFLKYYLNPYVNDAKQVYEILHVKMMGYIYFSDTSKKVIEESAKNIALHLELLFEKTGYKKIAFILPDTSDETFFAIHDLAKQWSQQKKITLYSMEQIPCNFKPECEFENYQIKYINPSESRDEFLISNKQNDQEQQDVWYSSLQSINLRASSLLDLVDGIICVCISGNTRKDSLEQLSKEFIMREKHLLGYIFLQ